MRNSAVPKQIGRYQIIDRVAVGGMAELFKAQLSGDYGFEKLVAIKKILPHLASDRSFVEMFFDEARITAQLDHRHIVSVFELGTDADTPYIAMQFIDGLDVLALLRECARTQLRLPATLAVCIARDLLDALDYAHHAKDSSGRPLQIIHRDISPGNVLLSWRGDVLLTDFGIARAVERRHKTEAGTLKGKYGYMAPEQVAGDAMDARADLFSVGVLLAEMLMARRLFVGSGELDVLLAIRDARIDRLYEHQREIPMAIMPILIKALAREPQARFQSAAEFREVLDEWLDHERTTRRDLAEFMAMVAAAPTSDLYASELRRTQGLPSAQESEAADAPEVSIEAEPEPPSLPRGAPPPLPTRSRAAATPPATTDAKLRMAEAEIAQLANRAFSRLPRASQPAFGGQSEADARPTPIPAEISSQAYQLVDDAEVDLSALCADPDAAVEHFDLSTTSVTRLLLSLAQQRRSGLLTVSGPHGERKRALIGDGHPLFVQSSNPSEHLGEFLVREQALTREDLAQALSLAHHFDGRLVDTLVAMRRLSPAMAYRYYAKHVALKLATTMAWRSGNATFQPGAFPAPKLPLLHLDMLRLLGVGASLLPDSFLAAWEHDIRDQSLYGVDSLTADLYQFGLGDALGHVQSLMSGRHRLSSVLHDGLVPVARGNFMRALYLLTQTEHVVVA